VIKFILLSILSYNLFASIQIIDTRNSISNDEISTLRTRILRAQDFYNLISNNFEDIEVRINPDNCLRTGYDYKKHHINFCKNKNTINSGLDSIDIINHETFHFLYCGEFKENCTQEKMKSLDHKGYMEGLADHFSYLMNTDKFFGEGFRIDFPYLRVYRNDLCFNLVSTPHLKGSALTSDLINSNLINLRTFYQNIDTALLTKKDCYSSNTMPILMAKDRKQSKRYWMNKSSTISFAINLPKSFSLRLISHLKLFETDQTTSSVTIKSRQSKGYEKIQFEILSHKKVVGFTQLYIGVR